MSLVAIQLRLKEAGPRPDTLEMSPLSTSSSISEEVDQESTDSRSAMDDTLWRKHGSAAQWFPGSSKVMWRIVLQVYLTFHLTAYAIIISIFLPTPSCPGDDCDGGSWMGEGAGLGLGVIAGITLVVSIILCLLQLAFFPVVHRRLGSLMSLQVFAPMGSVAYLAFLVFLLRMSSGFLRATLVLGIMSLHSLAKAVCQPAALVLINETTVTPSERVKTHSIAHAFNAAAAALGLWFGGYLLHFSLSVHFVGLVWIVLATVSGLGAALALKRDI